MVTSHKSTIHQAVVRLIVHSGTGRIEAERQWDSIYSKQYDRAVSGVTHTWKIGAYDFEFTKIFDGRDVDPFEVIAQAHTEAVTLETTSRTLSWVKLIAVLVIVISLVVITTTVFEDGSFISLGFIKGCLPWGLCS